MKQDNITKRNLIYLEVLRIIAIYLVLFNHTNGFLLYATHYPLPTSYLYLVISIISKVAVSVFFMISGALLLEKEESYLILYRKRILKYAIVLILFSFVYFAYFSYSNGLPIKINDFLKLLYSSNANAHFWFLYDYLAFLVMLPFIRKIVKSLTNKEYVYILIINIIFVGIIPIIEYLVNGGTIKYNPCFDLSAIVCSSLVYSLMGYFLNHQINCQNVKTKHLIIGFIFCLIAISITMGITIYVLKTEQIYTSNGLIDGNLVQKFLNNLIIVPAMYLFLVIKKIFTKINIPNKLQTLIKICGSCVFGVYIFEFVLRVKTVFIYDFLQGYLPIMVAYLLWTLIIIVIGFIIIFLLKKIPIIRKLF